MVANWRLGIRRYDLRRPIFKGGGGGGELNCLIDDHHDDMIYYRAPSGFGVKNHHSRAQPIIHANDFVSLDLKEFTKVCISQEYTHLM